MTWLSSLLYICLLLHGVFCKGEDKEQTLVYSTSVGGMANLVQLENKLMADLEVYASDMQRKLNMIRLYQQMMKRPAMQQHETQEEYVANPLNAFALLRRLQQDWPRWLAYLQEGQAKTQMDAMQQQLKKAPSEKDVQTAIAGLLRIESFYDLEASHMAKGMLLGKQYNSYIASPDCAALGDYLFNRSEYSRSMHWYRTALRLYKQPYDKLFSQVLGVKRKRLNRKFAQAIVYEPDDTEKSPVANIKPEWKEMAANMIKQLVSHSNSANIKKMVDKYLAAKEEIFIAHRARHKAKPTAMAKGCRGLWPKRQAHRLTCRYAQENSAFLRLAPLKLELLNQQPLIALYHDVLHDGEIEAVKNVASQRTTYEDETSTVKLTTLKFEKTHKLNRRIADMTGIDTTRNKELYLLNFGLGGYVKSKCESKNKKGNRLATVILYASNVPQGGATVFPKLHLVVNPKKGSALLWSNLNTDGETDPLTKHAVCPVVTGSRWVITKCIEKQQQVTKKLCLA